MNDYRARLLAESPPDWRIDTLGNLFDEREEKGYTDLPLLAVTGNSGITPRDQLKRRDTSSEDKSKYRLVKPGDIAYNTMRLWQGVLGLSQHEGIVSPAYTVLKPKNGIHSAFFYYLMKTPWMINSFLRYSSGLCSDTNNCKYESFRLVTTLVPSLPEQRKIAEILGSVDENIEKAQALIAKLQDLKKATMQELLTKGIGHTKFKDSPVGRIPEEWEVKSLQDITMKIVDGVHSTPKYTEIGVPFLTVENLTASNGISLSKVRYVSPEDHAIFIRRANPTVGDVLVSKDGTLGVARIVPGWFPEFSIFVSVAMLRPDKKQVLPELIRAFFDTGEYSRQLAYLSAGTGLKHIHLEHFRAFQIAIPPKAEQTELFSILNTMDKRINTKTEYLTRLKNLKKALMQDLLTGRVRVKI